MSSGNRTRSLSRRRLLKQAGATAIAGMAAPFTLIKPARAANTPITLALGWLPVGYFAPYYLAIEKGYYADQGVDVTLNHNSGNALAFKMLAAGNAEFAAADLMAMLQLQGKSPDPWMISMAVLYAKAPLTLFYLDGKGISQPKDLEGKTIVYSQGASTPFLLPLLAKANGFNADKVKWTAAAASAKMALLLQEQADVASDYILSKPGIEGKLQPGQKLKEFVFGDCGVNVYGDALITTEKFRKENPKACSGFVKATLRGFKDSFANPQAAVDAMAKKVLTLDKALAVKEVKLVEQIAIASEQQKNGLGFQDPDKMRASYDAVVNQLHQPIDRPIEALYSNDAI